LQLIKLLIEKIWVHGSYIAGKANLLFTIFVVFKGVHAFAAEGRLRFEGQKKEKPFSIPRCLWPQDPRSSKKRDRCFWGILGYKFISGMIPKSNARKCYLKESASFFDLAGTGSGFTPGESSFGTVYLI